MNVRAKFECGSVTKLKGGSEVVSFSAAIAGDDNKSWSRYTPTGTLSMSITAEGAVGRFKPGVEYFLDFTPVPAAQPA